jgi:hypothetical protein
MFVTTHWSYCTAYTFFLLHSSALAVPWGTSHSLTAGTPVTSHSVHSKEGFANMRSRYVPLYVYMHMCVCVCVRVCMCVCMCVCVRARAHALMSVCNTILQKCSCNYTPRCLTFVKNSVFARPDVTSAGLMKYVVMPSFSGSNNQIGWNHCVTSECG